MPSSLHDEITRNYYQTTAVRCHAPTREYYEASADLLRRRLGPWFPWDDGTCCLDLACGCGEMLYCLERQGVRYTAGVDLCAEELDQARRVVRGLLVHADVLDYLRQTESASVDFVTAFNFLEHVPKDKLTAILIEVRRILRRGGALVAMVPNAVSPFAGITRHWDITHEWAFTANNFRQLAAVSGFSPEVEFRECGPVPHGVISSLRYILWRLLRVVIAVWLLVEVADRKDGVYTMDMLVRLRLAGSAEDR